MTKFTTRSPLFSKMKGWTTQFSKTSNREYYVHTESGRRQWHKPDEKVEEDRQKIAEFYETLSHSGERQSIWRKFNNFLKVSIMKEFVYDLMCDYMEDFKYSVLDVGCGAGGDLGKWNNLGARSYIGFDASSAGIAELGRRSKSFPSLKVSSFNGNFCTQETWDRIPPGKSDVVSCQFAAHYAFAEKETVRIFFAGIYKALSQRGRAIIVTVDAESWRDSCRRNWGPANITVAKSSKIPFGDKYDFQLDSRVSAPEWWVHSDVFRLEAERVGLKVSFESNLASFASFIGVSTHRTDSARSFAWNTDHESTLLSMCGTDFVGPEAWAVASLYKVFVLTKPGVKVGSATSKDFEQWIVQN